LILFGGALLEKKIVTSDHRRPHQETIRNTVNPKNSRRNEICHFSVKKRKASHNTSTHNNTKGKKCVNWEKRKKMQKGGANRLALPTTADLPPGAVFGFSKCTAGRDNSWSYKYFRGENQQTNKIC
jgi:hypothetical protein